MNKLITIWVLALLLVLTPISANLGSQTFPVPGSDKPNIADEHIIDLVQDKILVPGDIFYHSKRFIENARLVVSFNEDKKIELKNEFAQRRIREANVLRNRGETNRADALLNESLILIEDILSKNVSNEIANDAKSTRQIINRANMNRLQLKEEVEANRPQRMTVQEGVPITPVIVEDIKNVSESVQRNIVSDKPLVEEIINEPSKPTDNINVPRATVSDSPKPSLPVKRII
jgi:hypothetical protein